MAVGARESGGAGSGPTTPPRLATGVVEEARWAERGLTPVPAHEFAIVGWDDTAARSGPATAGGEASCELDPVPQDRLMLVERLAFETDSAAATVLRVYAGAIDPSFLRARSVDGNGGELDFNQPIRIKSNARLVVRWSNATAGAIGVVTVQFVTVMAAPWRVGVDLAELGGR